MELIIAVLFPGPIKYDKGKYLPKDIAFFEVSFEDAAVMAKQLEKEGVKAIVSRGGTAESIQKAVNIPVVVAEATSFDIMQTIWSIKNEYPSKKRIGIINFGDISYDVDKMSEILDLEIKQFWYQNEKEMEKIVGKAFAQGIELFVGGMNGVKYANKIGAIGVAQGLGGETTIRAILKARDIINIRRQDLKRAERLRVILNFINEGIISLDSTGKVELFNPAAERILDLKREQVIGKNWLEMFPSSEWDRLFREQISQIGELRTIGNSKVVVSRIPIKSENMFMGAVSTFQEADVLQNTEQKIRKELNNLGLIARYNFDDIMGNSPKILEAVKKARLYAKADSTVLITGESGTGKEVFAQSIHQNSYRRNGAFVAINCAALPESLLESELFGYEEGAFTGAKKGGKPGMFELAHNGTIFLDEIGEMPVSVQARLLRVIQQKEVMRIGGGKNIPVNVRIIAATNRNLDQCIKDKTFREDLYYRLNILNLSIPSLREIAEDIPIILNYYINKYSQIYHKEVAIIPEDMINKLKTYNWPGNVRQLQNFAEKFVVLYGELSSEWKLVDDLFLNSLDSAQEIDSRQYALEDSRVNLSFDNGVDSPVIAIKVDNLNKMEEQIIQKVHELTGKNKTETANLLGISRTTVWKKTKS